MLLYERYVINRKIEKKTLKLFEFKDLCQAYVACSKGADELLKKQFLYGDMTDEMMAYLRSEESPRLVKRYYEECTNTEL